MGCNPLSIAAGRSHTIRLLRTLFDLGIISRGKFTWVHIRQLREVAGLSQWSAARRSGIPRMRLSLAESGQLALSPEEEAVLRRMLRAAIQAQQAQLEEVLREPVETT